VSGLWTKKKTAAYVAMSESWVQRHRRQLGGIDLGGRLRFRQESIDAYLEKQSLVPTATGRLEEVNPRRPVT